MDCSGGPVIKKPPTNAGDRGAIPGLGRFHMPTCYSATKPMHNYCTESTPRRTSAPQQRGHPNDPPHTATKSSPC